MPEAPPIVCEVCGTENPATATECQQCGIKLKSTAQSGDVERLLEELSAKPAPKEGAAGGGEESLDLDKEIVDELLDSLLVETSAAEAEERKKPPSPEARPAEVEVFECPVCGAEVASDAAACPSCGTKFGVPVEAPAEAAEAPAPPAGEPAAAIPAMAVSETEVSKVSALSGRLIDLVVAGTAAALVLIFFLFGMWSWSAVVATPFAMVLFLGIAGAGFGTGLGLFRMSTSAIAQGDRLVKEARYEEAIGMYDRAIRMGSRPATAWTSKGVAYKRMGRLDEAMRCHNVALKLNPKNEIAWCNKGDILFRASRLERAIESFDKAIEIWRGRLPGYIYQSSDGPWPKAPSTTATTAALGRSRPPTTR